MQPSCIQGEKQLEKHASIISYQSLRSIGSKQNPRTELYAPLVTRRFMIPFDKFWAFNEPKLVPKTGTT